MADTTFADNLYGSSDALRDIGAGLFGVCRTGSWFYERHARECKPGLWRVGMVGGPPDEFRDLIAERANAVMDDFGTLRRVH